MTAVVLVVIVVVVITAVGGAESRHIEGASHSDVIVVVAVVQRTRGR